MNTINDIILPMQKCLDTKDVKDIKKAKRKAKKWRENNKEYLSQYRKRYREKNKLEKLKLKWKEIYNKRKLNSNYKIINALRTRIHHFLKGNTKSFTTKELLGVPNIEFLWKHLESKFKPGMTRENHGKIWHIDHIIPCAAFDPFNTEHQKVLCNYSNLQPLFVKENLSKGCKILKKT